MKANNFEEGPNFFTKIGIPQGNGLSLVMFTLYLEIVIKKVGIKTSAQDISYADDVDLLSKKGIDLTEVEKVLKKWNLHMNNDKTKVLIIERNNDAWKSCKKLGMLLKTREEWKKRKTISIAAMAKLSKIWSSMISRKKMRIYNAYVQSIMRLRTGEMDKGMEQSIASFNRRMIRQACGIFWLNRMFPEKVNTLAEPASQIVA